MAKKLDAQRIEIARKQTSKRDNRELEKQHIRDTIAKNRSGEREGRVIMPEKKLYAFVFTICKQCGTADYFMCGKWVWIVSSSC